MSASRPSLLKFALTFLAPYRGRVFGAALALLFTASITLSIGQGIRILIDDGMATGSAHMLNRAVMMFFALALALAVGTFVRFYLVSWLGERVVTDIRERVFNHLLTLHPGFFDANRSLEIQSRLTTDTTLLQSVIGSSVSMALRNLLMMVGGIAWLFITNVKLTLIVMLAVPLVVFPILLFGRRVRKLSRDSQDRVADVGAYVGETLSNIRTVQAYNHEPWDQRYFADVAEGAFAVARKRVLQRAWLIAVVITLVLGAVGIMLWVGGNDVIAGTITGGELAAFVFYAIIVGSAVASISEVIGELQRAAGAAERLQELLDAKTDIAPPAAPAAQLPQPLRGAITLTDVCYHYPGHSDRKAIDGISLTIPAGESLALVGPSGAGKTTLFDLLLRFFDPQQGDICIDGVPIRSLDPADLRSCFALVPQQPALFFGSVADNLRYGRPQATQSELEAAARVANAHDFIVALPDGYDTRLGDGGVGLSGGQRQRLAIARAVLSDAPVLLLDEATSALDAQSEFLVQQALERLMQDRTTLVIAHRLATVRHADRIAVLEQGQIQALGTHEQLLSASPLYARLASLQFADGGADAEQAEHPSS